jgi:hypothetical protein
MARGTNLVALAEHDRWIRVIDANSGSEKCRTQAPGKGWLEAVALSADGRILAACSGTDESTISLWDVAGGQELGVLEGHRAYVIALVFWPDGKTLASAGADQTIRIWDVEDKRSLAVLRGHEDEIHRLALLPRRKRRRKRRTSSHEREPRRNPVCVRVGEACGHTINFPGRHMRKQPRPPPATGSNGGSSPSTKAMANGASAHSVFTGLIGLDPTWC